MTNDAVPLVADALAWDVPCVTCGYNLRGLTPEGACPECASPVAGSIRAAREPITPTAARGLARGCALLHVAAVVAALALPFAPFSPYPDGWLAPWLRTLTLAAILVSLVVGGWGAWVLTRFRLMPPRLGWGWNVVRRAARLLTTIGTSFYPALMAARYVMAPSGLRLPGGLPEAFAFATVAGTAMLYFYLGRIVASTGQQALAWTCRAHAALAMIGVAWTWSNGVFPMILMPIAGSGFPGAVNLGLVVYIEERTWPFSWWTAPVCVQSVVFLASLILLDSLRRALMRVAKRASGPESTAASSRP